MSQTVRGTTSIALNVPESLPDKRTYITFGLQRGGTSAVAGAQRAMGLYLGEIKGGNNEDVHFKHPPRNLGHLRKTIKKRDAANDVWGFKFPTASSYLAVLDDELRNPFYVAVYRDPVATALSRGRWDGPRMARASARTALSEANSLTNQNTGFVLATDRPVLLVSSAAGAADPSAMVDEVADFLGVDRPDDDLRSRLLAYLEPGSYKPFADYFGPNAKEVPGVDADPGDDDGEEEGDEPEDD